MYHSIYFGVQNPVCPSVCHTQKAVLQQVLPNPLNVQMCLHVPDKGCCCTVDLCLAQPCVESCGVESCALLHPSHSPTYLSHYRLSPLAALQRDGPGWSTPRRFAHSQIRDQPMPDNVSVYCHFFHDITIFLLLKYLVYLV
jgi:hypothetical protein